MNQANISGENIKNLSSKLNDMSDEQIQNMTRMQGLNIDPKTFRQQTQMLNGMSPEQLDSFAQMAKSMNLGPKMQQNQSTQNIQQNPKYQFIYSLKQEGNTLFKNKQYQEASNKYFEAIIEIDNIKQNQNSQEFNQLEISCRTNYMTAKAQLKEYDTVISQASQVIQLDNKNGKAYYRLAEGLNTIQKYQQAYQNIQKAYKYLPNDSNVKQLYDQLSKQCGQAQDENKEGNSSYKEPSFFDQNKKKDEVVIEDVPIEKKTTSNTQQDHLNDNNQLNDMTNQFKQMDSKTTAQMMKNQFGFDVSPDMIQNMQNMMTPEMIAQMKNIDPSMLNNKFANQQMSQNLNNTQQSNVQSNDQQQNPQQDQQPNMDPQQILQNPELILNALDMMKSNPQLLKTIFQGKLPDSILNNPKQISMLITILKFLFRIYLMVAKIWKYKMYIAIIIMGLIVYNFY